MTTLRSSSVNRKKKLGPQKSNQQLKSSNKQQMMRVTRSKAGQRTAQKREELISEVLPGFPSSTCNRRVRGSEDEEDRAMTEDTVMLEAETTLGTSLKQKQKHSSSQNESSVSTTTTQNDQATTIIECSILHCDESPMVAHYGELSNSKNLAAEVDRHQRDPQHRHSRRVVAPLIQHNQMPSSAGSLLKRGGNVSKLGNFTGKENRVEELAEQFNFMSRKDQETRPDPSYLERHGPKQLPNEYINGNMRTICCGWMVELSLEFKFQQETLMLAIRIFDRYLSLSHQPVSRKVLQLVAISSMLVASKMEEVVHPSVKDFSRMSADTFSISDVKRMEVALLQTLEYRIHSPPISSYVNIILEATDISPTAYHLACYLTEICSLHYTFLQFSPSLVASASVYVAGLICIRNNAPSCPQEDGEEKCGHGPTTEMAMTRVTGTDHMGQQKGLLAWTDKLTFLTGYTCKDLKKCAAKVAKTHTEVCKDLSPDSPLTPLKDKYRVFAKLCVSNEKPIELKH